MQFAASARPIVVAGSLFAALALLAGCGSATKTYSGPVQPLEIAFQPANQTVPLGSPATFNVIASGTGTLSYQWSVNGNAVSGATGATYTTSATIAADNNATYIVTVRDSTGATVTSNPAQLTLGPRSPQSGDLRFQQVDAPSVALQGATTATDINLDITHSVDTFGKSSGSPLELAPAFYNCDPAQLHDCSWSFWVDNQASADANLSMTYTCDAYDSLSTDLPSLSPPSSVVTSLDIPAGIDAFAVAVTSSTQSGAFDMEHEIVSPGALASTVSTDGLHSRVITAVAFDATGHLHLLSYGWKGDFTTAYDTSTAVVTAANVGTTAQTLAQNGYIITAFGGNEVNGYVLVGTKVQGDTLARPLQVFTQSSGAQPSGATSGYAPVGFVKYSDPAYPQAATDYTVLYEK